MACRCGILGRRRPAGPTQRPRCSARSAGLETWGRGTRRGLRGERSWTRRSRRARKRRREEARGGLRTFFFAQSGQSIPVGTASFWLLGHAIARPLGGGTRAVMRTCGCLEACCTASPKALAVAYSRTPLVSTACPDTHRPKA